MYICIYIYICIYNVCPNRALPPDPLGVHTGPEVARGLGLKLVLGGTTCLTLLV